MGRILAIAQSEGKKHDYALFKDERRWLKREWKFLTDTGFLGIKNTYFNALHPHKASKLHPLTDEQKAENRKISSARITIEHINARLKVFKIISNTYRNRCKKISLRTTLVAAIVNLNLGY